ncbi:MAG: DNA-directed RNA polymerase subunit omega [Oligoflexia bacterium]|nr:DNA-directed RNA polymerase subunit omega [Oligoflexia bacterium]
MARITVEDCLTKETNRFSLVLLAAKRTKQLLRGSKSQLSEDYDNKAVVMALREIADGKVRYMTAEELAEAKEREREAQAKALAERPVPVREAPVTADSIFITPAPPAASSGDGDDDEEESGRADLNGDSTV